jgi:hypothetical protein
MDNIVSFPGQRGRAKSEFSDPQEQASNKLHWRSRENVQKDIEKHIAAREAFAKAMAWEAAAESQNLPPAQIEAARERSAKAFAEMRKERSKAMKRRRR